MLKTQFEGINDSATVEFVRTSTVRVIEVICIACATIRPWESHVALARPIQRAAHTMSTARNRFQTILIFFKEKINKKLTLDQESTCKNFILASVADIAHLGQILIGIPCGCHIEVVANARCWCKTGFSRFRQFFLHRGILHRHHTYGVFQTHPPKNNHLFLQLLIIALILIL